MDGIIFDIQRFALHDGPGIRTTVFLKGCPLQCLWCHNPESQSFAPQISFVAERCTDSFRCIEECGSPAHRVVDGHHVFNHALSAECGPCVSACPSGALSWIGRSRTVDDIMAEVERDVAYYRRTGGGLTLSGGEPLAQPQFALALLNAARAAGIHTCLDTCGHAAGRHVRAAAEVTDVFLFDFKVADPSRHWKLTGETNALILDNLSLLDDLGAHIILRCPLIPNLNDTADHLSAIATLSRAFESIRLVEILPYHAMGLEKAIRIGRTIALPDQASATEDETRRWHSTLQELGCRNLAPLLGNHV
jgi:glycyl-radical enzyme activating protein